MKFILIGFGGTGNEIVNNVYGRIPASMKNDFIAYAIDTDQDDLRELNHIAPNNIIVTSRDETVGLIKYKYQNKSFDFLSNHRSISDTLIAEGAGQVRQVSRFGYETMENDLSALTTGVNGMILQAQQNNEGIQVYYIGSICGGTGSGSMLQLAYFLSNYISNINQGVAINTTACLLLPGVFTEVKDVDLDSDQKSRIKANAYAFMKEWHTYNSIFQNQYEGDNSNFEFLHLNLGDVGGINYSISKYDMENRNPIFQEPFKSFLCMDNTSANGGSLSYLQDYKDMLEDYLFFYTTTGVAASASSRLVNQLPQLMSAGVGGLQRFNGLGVSKLLYPKNNIEELAALQIFRESFSTDYLRLDKEYLKEKKSIEERKKFGDFSHEELSRGEFFTRQFLEYAANDTGIFDGFYKLCDTELKYAKRDEGQSVIEYVYKHDICYERIQDFIENKTKQITTTTNIPAIDYFQNAVNSFIESFNKKEEKTGEVIKLEKQIIEFEYQISKISDSTIKNIATSIISFNDTSIGVIKGSRQHDFSVLHYMLGSTDESESIGVMNPVSIRFFLYKLTSLLRDRFESLHQRVLGSNEDYTGEIQEILDNLEEERGRDYLETTPEVENPVEAIRKAEEKNRKWGGALKHINNHTKDFWRVYKPAIENETSELINLFLKSVEYRVLEVVVNQLEMMTSLWEKYFTNVEYLFNRENNYVDQSIEKLSRLSSIQHYQEIFYDENIENAIKYKKDFIEHIYKSEGVGENLSEKITETLTLQTLSVLKELNEKDQALDIQNIKLGAKEIITSLTQSIKNMKLFDMSLIQAWEKHLTIRGISEIPEFMESKLERIKRVSGPYMVAGYNNSETNTYIFWGIHKDNELAIQEMANPALSRKLGVQLVDNNIANIFNANQSGEGYISDNPVLTPYEIICNSLSTSFSFNNIFDFIGPQKPRIEDIFRHPQNAGSYYKSYFSEKLRNWLYGEASVHIDERWSGLHILKDLNGDVDEMFEKEVKRAFIRGLAMNWFRSIKNDDRENTWKIDCNWFDDPTKREGFLFSKQLPVEARFYDLFKGLFDNMHIVLLINGYQDVIKGYSGAFEQQFNADRKGSSRYSWRYHRFIKGCSLPIHYELFKKTKFNILDVICSLHQEGPNNNETFKLQEELLHILFEELINYHQKVYGKADNYQRRLRNVINDILETSKIAGSSSSTADCKLRERWFEIIDNYYGLERILKTKFKLCAPK